MFAPPPPAPTQASDSGNAQRSPAALPVVASRRAQDRRAARCGVDGHPPVSAPRAGSVAAAGLSAVSGGPQAGMVGKGAAAQPEGAPPTQLEGATRASSGSPPPSPHLQVEHVAPPVADEMVPALPRPPASLVPASELRQIAELREPEPPLARGSVPREGLAAPGERAGALLVVAHPHASARPGPRHPEARVQLQPAVQPFTGSSGASLSAALASSRLQPRSPPHQ